MTDTSKPVRRPAAERQPVVLIVEDEILIRWPFAEHLREAGFAVIEAGNAAEALAVIEAGAPVDLVFADIMTPGAVDGLALARRLASHRSDLPVLLTSGGAGAPVAAYVAQRRFVAKPYVFSEVEARIRELLAAR
jgi:CheY-like chemotaxis protein